MLFTEKRQEAFLRLSQMRSYLRGPGVPRFRRIMAEHVGAVHPLHPFGLDEAGLDLRNPLVVCMGDSVTAGHFEQLCTLQELCQPARQLLPNGDQTARPTSRVDVLAAYPEILRRLLIRYNGQTCLTVLNSGLAGDTIEGVLARLDRDALSHKPDLLVLNASLNWLPQNKEIDRYAEALRRCVERILNQPETELILLTPNRMSHLNPQPVLEGLEARVARIRALAAEYGISLVDVYQLWSDFFLDEEELEGALANRLNHPTPLGQRVYAEALMHAIEM